MASSLSQSFASFDRVLVDAVVPLSGIHQVSQIPQIQFIEDAPQGVLRNRNTGPTVQSGAITETPIWDQGLHGEGQIIGLIDSLPFLGHQMFFDDVPVGPDHRKFVAWRNPGSTHSHGTFVAGVLAGDMGTIGVHDIDDGVAFAARISYSDYFNVDAHPSTLIERLTRRSQRRGTYTLKQLGRRQHDELHNVVQASG